ncbi:membrane protein [Spirochaetia bacterium]|nr:membrane protein [Spirochaetia bacterium]
MRLDGIDWNDEKNEINKRLHHVGFEDAQYIFEDSNRLERIDESEGNTSGEERWQTLGMVGKTLFAAYTERGSKKRLITARVATKQERRSYNGYYQIDGEGWSKAT